MAPDRDPVASFDMNFRLMRITGMWPGPGLLQASYWWVVLFCNVGLFGCTVLHAVLISGADLARFTEDMMVIFCVWYALIQLILIRASRQKLEEFVSRVEKTICLLHDSVSSQEQRDVLRNAVRKSRRLTYCLVVVYMITVTNYIVYSRTAMGQSLPLPIWTPFAQDVSPTQELLLIFELVGSILSFSGAGAVVGLFTSLLLLLRANARVAELQFQAHDPEKRDDKEAMRTFIAGVKIHQSAMDQCSILDQIVTPFYTQQLFTTVGIICACAYQVSTGPFEPNRVRFYVVGTCILLQAFFVSWFATELAEQGEAVDQGVLAGNWALEGAWLRASAVLVVLRSQRGCSLKMVNVAKVGLPVFLELLRLSYSFTAFLLRAERQQGSEKEIPVQ